eukprot:TRINITY_DN2849_c0_g1_i1.p1 TRINITY_DN2849_c0_g1~~TRINITY_DN2849_c0_g1_i1.p1  ORF type:complete len:414 (+),score=124.57 TRINITY_DN2849_c0_g1_i1:46-1287(+)
MSSKNTQDQNKATDENWKDSIDRNPVDERPQTEDVTATKGLSFAGWNLKKELQMGIYAKGWDEPSPIQEEAIPQILLGNDVLARAKNGTGKTAAFCIPALEHINTTLDLPQVIIIEPTRELAFQTSKVLVDLAKYMEDTKIMVTTGGTNVQDDLERLKNPVHIIVGTPGRLKHLFEVKRLRADNVSMFILDEADALLGDSFVDDIEVIIRKLPRERQILLFSATFPVSVATFQEKWMDTDTRTVKTMNELTLIGVDQFYAYINEGQKLSLLRQILTDIPFNQLVIFVASAKRSQELAILMTNWGIRTLFIHSFIEQDERNRIVHDFREGIFRILVCTDLFTRGIDIAGVDLVINFDFPSSKMDRPGSKYLHRIGRTGRYGHFGKAISFITDDDTANLFKVEKQLGTKIGPLKL